MGSEGGVTEEQRDPPDRGSLPLCSSGGGFNHVEHEWASPQWQGVLSERCVLTKAGVYAAETESCIIFLGPTQVAGGAFTLARQPQIIHEKLVPSPPGVPLRLGPSPLPGEARPQGSLQVGRPWPIATLLQHPLLLPHLQDGHHYLSRQGSHRWSLPLCVARESIAVVWLTVEFTCRQQEAGTEAISQAPILNVPPWSQPLLSISSSLRRPSSHPAFPGPSFLVYWESSSSQ